MVKILKNIPKAWQFLLLVILMLCTVYFFDPIAAKLTLLNSYKILKKLLPSLFLIFAFMFIFNILVTDKIIKKHLQKENGLKKYFIVALAGILSTGPIYMWFAFLSTMKDKGVNEGLLSIFLYNRAIKLPLLPLMIDYFSFKTTIVISILVFIFSFINAIFINLFFKKQHENSNRIQR